MTSPIAHPVADVDRARDDLAADAEAEIGLVAGAHDADELAGRAAGLERDALHLDRPLRLGAGAVSAWQAASRSAAASTSQRQRLASHSANGNADHDD